MFENKRLILSIAALVLVGFAIEFLKDMGDDLGARNSQRLGGSDYANIDSRNFVRTNRNNDKSYAVDTSKRRPFKLSGVDPNMGEYDANGPKAKGKGKLKKKKKKKKKKKAKKKKGKASGLEVIVYEESNKPEFEPYKEEGDDDSAGYTPISQEEEETSRYDEWAAKLLVRPDRIETLAFIREFQSGKIEPDTFYRLVDEMYAQDIAEFRSLAVLAAGAAPSLRSYNFLIVAYSEDTDSGVRSEATGELRDYNVLQHLWIPRSVISAIQSQSPASVSVAATAIDVASAAYLTPRASASNDEQPAAPAVRGEFKSYFVSLIPALEVAIERYKESPDVVTSLTNALNRIQQLDVVAINEEF